MRCFQGPMAVDARYSSCTRHGLSPQPMLHEQLGSEAQEYDGQVDFVSTRGAMLHCMRSHHCTECWCPQSNAGGHILLLPLLTRLHSESLLFLIWGLRRIFLASIHYTFLSYSITIHFLLHYLSLLTPLQSKSLPFLIWGLRRISLAGPHYSFVLTPLLL